VPDGEPAIRVVEDRRALSRQAGYYQTEVATSKFFPKVFLI
jgi:hypothetical protein